jgi:ribosomal protein S18 acetylase RimI-like enzyme
VERLRPDQHATAARTLAAAFWDDPLMHIVAPDEKRRAKVAPWFFDRAVAAGQRWGEVSCNEDASAVAVWFAPGNTDLTAGRMLRVGLGSLPLKAGLSGTMRFMRALTATEKFHKAVKGPHWYLMAIGTDPSQQSKGLGSALIEVGTAQADAAHLPCYLETATESNVAFYTKRGFEVTDQVQLYGFMLYGMLRQPR